MDGITNKALTYLFSITKYLYFNVEADKEIKIDSLAIKTNQEKFKSAINFIIDQNICILGGFVIRYGDETRETIVKKKVDTKGALEKYSKLWE